MIFLYIWITFSYNLSKIYPYTHAVNLCAKCQFIRRQLWIYGPIALFDSVYYSLKVSKIIWYGQLNLQNNMCSWAKLKHATETRKNKNLLYSIGCVGKKLIVLKKNLTEIGSSHLHASFGTFCVQIGQSLGTQWALNIRMKSKSATFLFKCSMCLE